MKSALCFIVSLFVFIGTSPAWAGTIYVDAANTSGFEDGSLAQPYDTIVEAVDSAAPGDTVSVAPGIYYGRIELKDSINIISQDGPEKTFVKALDDYWVIRALNVGFGLDINIEGFTFTDSRYVIYAYRTSKITVRNCVIENAYVGAAASMAAGMDFYNTVFKNISGYAVHSIWNTGPQLFNVTIDNAASAASVYQTPFKLTNTTITNSDTVFSVSLNPAFVGSNVNIYGYNKMFSDGYDPSRYYVTDIISVDPLFVEPGSDFHLQGASPLIDAGIDIGLPFVGFAPDIGAYEFAELSLVQQAENLAASVADAPAQIFNNSEGTLQNALYNKLEAILHMVFTYDKENMKTDRGRVLKGCLAKLRNDILAKIDGHVGGNPANDWLEDGEEKTELYNNVVNLIETVEEELASL